jgi:hypothetical protein
MSFFIALYANDSNVGIGQKFHGGWQHAKTRTKNWHEHWTLRNFDAIGFGKRSSHTNLCRRNIAQSFSDNHERKAAHFGTEELIRSILISKMRECFSNNRVIDNGDFYGHVPIFADG